MCIFPPFWGREDSVLVTEEIFLKEIKVDVGKGLVDRLLS